MLCSPSPTTSSQLAFPVPSASWPFPAPSLSLCTMRLCLFCLLSASLFTTPITSACLQATLISLWRHYSSSCMCFKRCPLSPRQTESSLLWHTLSFMIGLSFSLQWDLWLSYLLKCPGSSHTKLLAVSWCPLFSHSSVRFWCSSFVLMPASSPVMYS